MKNVTMCLTLEQVSHAAEPVEYTPRGMPGGWARFLDFVQENYGLSTFQGWTVTDFFRAILAYVFERAASPPFVCSQLFEDLDDDTPAYKLSVFDVTYDMLDAIDRNVQPSWFSVEIQPHDALYTVVLIPKRSLMKLIYKNLE